MLEFPRWKYVLIVLILAVSVLYALPNKYQKDPSVQITANRGAQVDDAEITAFLHHLNYSPVMAALYARLLAGWAAVTDAPFNAFVDVTAPGKWGSWGALRHLGDENPRWSVLAKGCGSC